MDSRQAMRECWLCHLPSFVTSEKSFSLNFAFLIWVHVKEFGLYFKKLFGR